MDLTSGYEWAPPDDWRSLRVIDAHTGGEPFRIVVSGLPYIPGATVLDRRRYASENLDHLRRILMWEPRGHADMYGGWIGPPVSDSADLSVLFLHNAGFSTMCGHGIIALTTALYELGLIDDDKTTLGIDTPAGLVVATPHFADGRTEKVSFRNVPSFAHSLDNVIRHPDLGELRYDIAFGGAFYAYIDVGGLPIEWPPSAGHLSDLGRDLKNRIIDETELVHPEQPDLGFLYGVIFTGPPQLETNSFRNVCVFADGEVDRSPTGTGVSGHVALQAARGTLSVDDSIRVESIVGSVFAGRVAGKSKVGEYQAVISEVTGSAHLVGKSEFWVDPSDPLAEGFLLR